MVAAKVFQRFLTLPTTWPVARLMFPIRDLRRQMETLLQTYCFEIQVTCARPTEQDKSVQLVYYSLVMFPLSMPCLKD